MTRSEIIDLITRVQDAVTHRDATALANFHAEDCVVESPIAGGQARGREAIARSYEAFFHAFPDLRLDSTDQSDEVHQALALGLGRHGAPF